MSAACSVPHGAHSQRWDGQLQTGLGATPDKSHNASQSDCSKDGSDGGDPQAADAAASAVDTRRAERDRESASKDDHGSATKTSVGHAPIAEIVPRTSAVGPRATAGVSFRSGVAGSGMHIHKGVDISHTTSTTPVTCRHQNRV